LSAAPPTYQCSTTTTKSDLVDTAVAHIKIVVAVTDRLTELGNSEAELRTISLRLQEAAFRALTSPREE
jgi:hypothetical protein